MMGDVQIKGLLYGKVQINRRLDIEKNTLVSRTSVSRMMNPRVLSLTSIGLFIQSNVFNHLSNTALPFQFYEIRTSKKTSVLLIT